MSASEIRVSRTIDAAASAVWYVLTDLDNAESVLSGVEKVERLDSTRYEVGTRWRETRVLFGKSSSEEMWVAEIDPEKRTVVKASSRGADYTTVFTLTPVGDSTTLTFHFSAEASGMGAFSRFLMKVFGSFALKATTKMIRQDLDDIATAAEKRTA
ncbi:SRPBCC family protein [Rhodococcus sp. NPDC056960]|uniref:SRPBCC family protein n=1 Tax=Rhodococcus sp. NPDC056960 TaxID=3345982 RepID=UPI00362606A4